MASKQSPSPEQAKPSDASGEKEEEEAFLVTLFKFHEGEAHTQPQSSTSSRVHTWKGLLECRMFLGCRSFWNQELVCTASFLLSS